MEEERKKGMEASGSWESLVVEWTPEEVLPPHPFPGCVLFLPCALIHQLCLIGMDLSMLSVPVAPVRFAIAWHVRILVGGRRGYRAGRRTWKLCYYDYYSFVLHLPSSISQLCSVPYDYDQFFYEVIMCSIS